MKGILLVNLGTPAQCEKAHVRRFIGDILADPLVFGQPEWISNFVARKIIAPLGAAESLKKYELIWRKKAPLISPLIFHMQMLATALEAKTGSPVALAMRYGAPEVKQAFDELLKKMPEMKEVIVFQLFPHYAQSTTLTTQKFITDIFNQHNYAFRLKFIAPYYRHPAYIHALSERIRPYIDEKTDHIVFSYHSLPVNQVKAGQKKGKAFDYLYQLKETNRLIIEKLQFPKEKQSLMFASQRRGKWMKPFLKDTIAKLPQNGAKNITICAPGFPIDNMETLFDLDYEARKFFMEAGGETFRFVPSLNDAPCWVDAIAEIIADAEI